MTSQPVLQPCPFCGAPAELAEGGDHHGDYFTLGCSRLDCVAHWLIYTEPAAKLVSAVAAWNMRAVAAL